MGEGDFSIAAAQSALAGDLLVILALQRIWTIRLNEVLVDPVRYEL